MLKLKMGNGQIISKYNLIDFLKLLYLIIINLYNTNYC